MLFDTRERQWTKLTDLAVSLPTWSSDSRYVYFDSLENVPKLYRVRIRDHRLEEITSLASIRRAPWECLQLERSEPGRFSSDSARRRHPGNL